MPIAGDLLETDLGQLPALAAQVPRQIDDLLAAAHDPNSTLTASAGIDAVEQTVDAWAASTEQIERQLESHALEYPADRFDVEARLAGIALLHLSLAEDVAILAPLDTLPADTPMAAALAQVALPARATVTVAVLEDGGLRESLAQPIEADSPEDHDAVEEAEEEPDVRHKLITEAVDDVVKDIVDRAGGACSSVVLGLGGLAIQAAHPLAEALNLAPGFIAEALKREYRKIATLVKSLVNRAKKIFSSICSNYRDVLAPEQDEVMNAVSDPIGAALIARLLDADKVRAAATLKLSEAKDDREMDDRIQRMKKLKKLHARWVGPVRYVGDGLPLLVPVMIGPVSAAAIAGVGLLAWSVLVTGDQLDTSRRFFPDCWPGVVRRAGGE
jgi:hypothetical protein